MAPPVRAVVAIMPAAAPSFSGFDGAQRRALVRCVEQRPADAPNDQRQHDAEKRCVDIQRRQEKLRHGNDRAANGAEQARTEPIGKRAGDGRHDHDDHRIGDDDPANLGGRVAQ